MSVATIVPPWDDATVHALRKRQAMANLHPYTCGTDSRHGPLIPGREGWFCETCDYRQTWAHRADLHIVEVFA